MNKKILLFPLWLIGSSFLLVWTLAMYKAGDASIKPEVKSMSVTRTGSSPQLLYSAVPDRRVNIRTAIKSADGREEMLRQYLSRYDSHLVEHADLLVEVADKYDFDYRWMVAIAQQESNLCKKIPYNSYNCWGWGIYCLDYDQEAQKCNKMQVISFESYEDAIKRIAPQFKKKFVADEDISPEEVMQTYTPPSDGSWAFGISQFMSEME